MKRTKKLRVKIWGSHFHRRFSLGLFLVAIFTGCQLSQPPPPVLGKLPDFHLTDQNRQPVTLKDYQGKIWVADFIFTSCAGTCPLLTERMKKVQGAIQELETDSEKIPLRIVSFSVDPERDTPEKLSNYAKAHGADEKFWTFLTGPVDQVTTTVVKGFKISMGKIPREGLSKAEIFDVVHGEKFVLVDGHGQIRGYYDSDSPGLKKLIADMKHLLKKVS